MRLYRRLMHFIRIITILFLILWRHPRSLGRARTRVAQGVHQILIEVPLLVLHGRLRRVRNQGRLYLLHGADFLDRR